MITEEELKKKAKKWSGGKQQKWAEMLEHNEALQKAGEAGEKVTVRWNKKGEQETTTGKISQADGFWLLCCCDDTDESGRIRGQYQVRGFVCIDDINSGESQYIELFDIESVEGSA